MPTEYETVNKISDEGTKSRPRPTPTIDQHKKPIFIYVLTVLSAIGGFLFGYDTGVVSGAMLLVRDEFHLSTAWHEAIVSGTVAAAWLFALVGGWFTDKVGRKPVILAASLFFTAGSVVMGLATHKEVLLTGRIIVGVGIGLASMSVPVYIAESALPEDRGHHVTLNTLFITGGQFIAAAICGAFSEHVHGWRYMLGLAAVPAVIQFFGFLGMPESPRWLVSHGRSSEALKVLRSIRAVGYPVEEELENIKVAYERDLSASSSSTWRRVLTTSNTRRALILGCLLQAFQQLAGINTVMYYSASIIQMAGVKDYSIAIWLACVVASINFLCTFIGLFLVERMGRRPLTLGSLTGVVISLAMLGVAFHMMELDSPAVTMAGDAFCGSVSTCAECIASANQCGFCYWDTPSGATNGSCWVQLEQRPEHGPCSNISSVSGVSGLTWAIGWCPSRYSWLAVTALGVYLLFFAPGMGPMPWTINSEIYPTWARSFGTSLATSTNWMFNLLISMTFLTLTEVLTKEGAFFLYAGFAAVGLVSFFVILPETKGRSLEEMEILFDSPLCSRGLTNSKSVQHIGSQEERLPFNVGDAITSSPDKSGS